MGEGLSEVSRSRLAMELAGFAVAFVSVVVLRAIGFQNAPFVVLAAALTAGIAVAMIILANGW